MSVHSLYIGFTTTLKASPLTLNLFISLTETTKRFVFFFLEVARGQ